MSEHKPTGFVVGVTGVECQTCKGVPWPCRPFLQAQVERLTQELEVIGEVLTEHGQPKPYPETPGQFRADRIHWLAASRDTFRGQRDEAHRQLAAVVRVAQDSLAEAVAMMLVFKKLNVPWDWESTEQNLESAAAVLADLPAAAQEIGAKLERAEKLAEALRQAEEHCEELREAWERGALDEHDGKGGTRSNRNYDALLSIRAALREEGK